MKKCPKCGKIYDDSWKVCLHCNEIVTNDLSLTATNPELREQCRKEANIFWPNTREEASKAIKNLSFLFYLILAVKAVGVYMRGLIPIEIAEWLLILFMVYIVQKRKSRVASIIIILLVLLGQILQIFIIGITPKAWTAMLSITRIALIVACIGLVRASFVFHKKLVRHDT